MEKKKVEVMIGGNVYFLQGTESENHIHNVASLIDEKIDEIRKNMYSNLPTQEKLHMLISINLADDYLKLKEVLRQRDEELERTYKEFAKCNDENMALEERIKEMALEISALKLKQAEWESQIQEQLLSQKQSEQTHTEDDQVTSQITNQNQKELIKMQRPQHTKHQRRGGR